MPRYATADGKGTERRIAGAQDPEGRRRSNNPAREVWIQETALSTALNTSYMATQVGLFGIVVGIALLLSGIGFAILAVGGALRNPDSVLQRARRQAPRSPAWPPRPLPPARGPCFTAGGCSRPAGARSARRPASSCRPARGRQERGPRRRRYSQNGERPALLAGASGDGRTGHAPELRPEDIPAAPVSLRRIARLFSPYRPRLGAAAEPDLPRPGLGVISPFLLREIINTAYPQHDTHAARRAGGGDDRAVGHHERDRRRPDVDLQPGRPARDARPARRRLRAPAAHVAGVLHAHPHGRGAVADRQRHRRRSTASSPRPPPRSSRTSRRSSRRSSRCSCSTGAWRSSR